MKKIIALLLITTLLLTGCGSDSKQEKNTCCTCLDAPNLDVCCSCDNPYLNRK